MKKTKPSEKIKQISIGLYSRQIEFLKLHGFFDINKLTRDTLDSQIKIINANYLEQFNE